MQLGRRVYGVNAADVTEVCRPLPATALPGGPKWLRGIANFKGEIIPVVDLSVFDPVAAVDEPQKTKFVISSGRAGPKMALVVDRLYEMISEPDEINPAHNGVERSMPGVTGSATHNNFTIFLLDLEHLVSNLRPS
jgi:chemotaxis signal transduction protein